MYCDRIKKKVINPKPKIKIKKISQSISHVDANNSIGFVAADIAIKTAIKNAKKTGIGMVAVKNSGHYGLSGYYAEQAVKKNLVVMIYTKGLGKGKKLHDKRESIKNKEWGLKKQRMLKKRSI